MNDRSTTVQTNESQLWEKIRDKPYCDPSKRMDFVLFFDVRDGNPNGDPDAGNLPRMDPETRHGIVTDVCIKRKIRDYFATVLERSIFIQSQDALNTLYFRAARDVVHREPKDEEAKAVEALLVELNVETNTIFKDLIALHENNEEASNESGSSGEPQSNFRDWLASISIDGFDFDPECGTLSYLGEANSKDKFKKLLSQEEFEPDAWKDQIESLAKLLNDAKPKKGAQERTARNAVKKRMCEVYDDIRLFGGVLTAGTNAGQIRGPLQLTFARSVAPILQQDAAITRCAITTAADFQKKQTEFGRKPWLNWAIYSQHGFFNPFLGEETGVTRDDLARFWEALTCMFRNCDAASKGEMTMHDIIVFVHDHRRGNAPSHLLFEKVKCETDDQVSNGYHQIRIARDGFDKTYSVLSPASQSTVNTGVKVYHPLNDIWNG